MTDDMTWVSYAEVRPLAKAPIVFAPYEALPKLVQELLGHVKADSEQIPELDPFCLIVDPAGAIATARRVSPIGAAGGGTVLDEVGPRDFGINMPVAWVDDVRACEYAIVCGYRDPFLASYVAEAKDASPALWSRLVGTERLGVARAFSVVRALR